MATIVGALGSNLALATALSAVSGTTPAASTPSVPPAVATESPSDSDTAATTLLTTPSTNSSSTTLNNAAPVLVDCEVNDDEESLADPDLDSLREEIFSLIRHISDPEHPHTIEALGVVYKKGVKVRREEEQEFVEIEFKPTVPHCSLATLIGLCIRTKIMREIPTIKFSIQIQRGTHQTEAEINKQLNDKERATAALENPALRETVERLIKNQRAFE